MRYNRHEYLILRRAAEYLHETVRRYHAHRLTMGMILGFYAPLALVTFSLYGASNYPFEFGSLMWGDSNLMHILKTAVPFVVFTGTINIIIALRVTRGLPEKLVACEVYKIELRMNARAGVIEELVYRFLVLLVFIPFAELVNYLFGGFSDNHQGPLAWATNGFIAPFFNGVSFGIVEEQMMGASWALALSILISNMLFTKGHIYQGLLGVYHSWFMGFGFFYLTFTHGLVIAMIFHALLNSLVSTIVYADTHWDTRHYKRWKR